MLQRLAVARVHFPDCPDFLPPAWAIRQMAQRQPYVVADRLGPAVQQDLFEPFANVESAHLGPPLPREASAKWGLPIAELAERRIINTDVPVNPFTIYHIVSYGMFVKSILVF